MASPSNPFNPLSTDAARQYDDLLPSDSESSTTSSVSRDVDARSDNSRHRPQPQPQPRTQPPRCPWRTPRFHDMECSRFFDCPSHHVERSLSDAGTDQQSTHSAARDDSSSPASEDDDTFHSDNENSSLDSQRNAPHLDHNIDSASTSQQRDESEAQGAEQEHGHAVQSTSARDGTNNASLQNDHDALGLLDTSSNTSTNQQGTENRPEVSPSGSSGSRRTWTPVSRERMDAPLPLPQQGRTREDSLPPLPQPPQGETVRRPSDSLPRWQPDAEVTYCPICHAQFSFFVRKHHCRKCGRVVCNSCSPHRIIIPYQYIVRPPGSEVPIPHSLLIDGLGGGGGYFDVNDMSGGDRVRLCNPCVPDPNTAPPQSPNPQASLSPRSTHQRSRSSIGNTYGTLSSSNRHGAVFATGNSGDSYRYLSSRTRSITMGPPAAGPSSGTAYRHRSGTHQTPIERLLSGAATASPSSSYPSRYNSLGEASSSSSRQRALPPTPQIAEEDECPICHRELPPSTLPDSEALREAHVAMCIQTHSAYGTPRGNEGDARAAPRRTGMYTYAATEKDCVDDAECTICLEEFTVGVAMARLECLCRFHRTCISSWFVKHPGRCPVHQHDGFGY